MATKTSARRRGDSQKKKIQELYQKLLLEMGRKDAELNRAEIERLLKRFELTPGDEKDKLIKKDALLAEGITELKDHGKKMVNEASLFVFWVGFCFDTTEAILSELKDRSFPPKPEPDEPDR